MKVCVVIAAYNEAQVIKEVITNVKKHNDFVVVVDDGSKDDTAQQALSAGAIVLTLPVNRGQGAALATGIEYALQVGADIIVTYDADGQFIPEQIAGVIQPIIDRKAEVVLGSRFIGTVDNLSIVKKIVLKLAVGITNFYAGLKLSDVHNGFRAFSAAAARKIAISQDRMAHASEILELIRKHRLMYVEAPVTVKYSQYSKQKGQKISGLLKISWDLLISRIIKNI